MPTVKLLLYKHRTTSDGRHPIYLRITVNRKQKYVSTGFACFEKDWSVKDEQLKKSFGYEFDRINKVLRDKKNEALSAMLDLQLAKKFVTSTKVKQMITGERSSNFFLFAEKVNAEYLKEAKGGTYRKIEVLLKDIERFWKSKNLLLAEIDPDWIDGYKNHLRGMGNDTNTVTGKLKKIRTILNKAKASRPPLISENPFDSVRLENKETRKAKLKEIDLIKLLAVDLPKGSAAFHSYNAFMFSFFAWGMRFRDVMLFEKRFIHDDRIFYTARKTDKDFSVPMNDKLEEIVNYYMENTDGKFLFPFIQTIPADVIEMEKMIDCLNVTVNRNLKKIATLADVPDFTFHIARHSFADRAKKKGVDPAKSMEFLGHSDYDTHKIYLSKFDDEELDKQSEIVYSGLY